MEFGITANGWKKIAIRAEFFGYKFIMVPHSCPSCEPWNFPDTHEGHQFDLEQAFEDMGLIAQEGGLFCIGCGDMVLELSVESPPVEINALQELATLHACGPEKEDDSE